MFMCYLRIHLVQYMHAVCYCFLNTLNVYIHNYMINLHYAMSHLAWLRSVGIIDR